MLRVLSKSRVTRSLRESREGSGGPWDPRIGRYSQANRWEVSMEGHSSGGKDLEHVAYPTPSAPTKKGSGIDSVEHAGETNPPRRPLRK